VTGYTESTDYDVTPGAFQTTNGGGRDVFVTKLNATGTALVYSTYIGGSGEDRGYAIAVDGSGNAYVTGYTGSTDYDVTPRAFQTTKGGGYDVFVTKLNATGTALFYSTYIGGSNDDVGRAIAVDGSGYAYVTGATNSADYPVTPGAFQTTKGGGADVFVTKLNAAGTALVYSTYIGGSGDDLGWAIAVDGSGYAYVTGATNSPDYDVTPGAFQTTKGGRWDVFVTKVCHSTIIGNTCQPSSLIGGSGGGPRWRVYPNPTSGSFVIESSEDGTFELINGHGQVVQVYEVRRGRAELQATLSAGVYYLREQRSGTVQKVVILE
jgi:hypothetical protein